MALPASNSLSHLQLFKVGKIMLSKYGHLTLSSGTFPDKVTPGINFTDEAVVQCDVPVVKILLQVLEIYKRLQINLI